MTDGSTAFPTDQLLDALEVAVVVFDIDGRILLANQRARDDLALLGDPREYEGSLFTQPFDLVDEHGQPLTPDDVPTARTLRKDRRELCPAHRRDMTRRRESQAIAEAERWSKGKRCKHVGFQF